VFVHVLLKIDSHAFLGGFRGYFVVLLVLSHGLGSSVNIATDYGLEDPGSDPGGDEIFHRSRPALGPTQPPVQQWVPGLSWG